MKKDKKHFLHPFITFSIYVLGVTIEITTIKVTNLNPNSNPFYGLSNVKFPSHLHIQARNINLIL